MLRVYTWWAEGKNCTRLHSGVEQSSEEVQKELAKTRDQTPDKGREGVRPSQGFRLGC